MLAGYIIGIFSIPKYLSRRPRCGSRLLPASYFASVSILVRVCSHYFIALLGLSNALMWPAIFPLAIRGLGKFTKMALPCS